MEQPLPMSLPPLIPSDFGSSLGPPGNENFPPLGPPGPPFPGDMNTPLPPRSATPDNIRNISPNSSIAGSVVCFTSFLIFYLCILCCRRVFCCECWRGDRCLVELPPHENIFLVSLSEHTKVITRNYQCRFQNSDCVVLSRCGQLQGWFSLGCQGYRSWSTLGPGRGFHRVCGVKGPQRRGTVRSAKVIKVVWKFWGDPNTSDCLQGGSHYLVILSAIVNNRLLTIKNK